MNELQVSALEAFMKCPGLPLAGKLEWRQRVLDALTTGKANRDTLATEADARGEHDTAWEHAVHAVTLAGFRDVARYGAKWRGFLYLVEITADEAAWLAYVAACEAENLDAHGFRTWRVHGCPVGPL